MVEDEVDEPEDDDLLKDLLTIEIDSVAYLSCPALLDTLQSGALDNSGLENSGSFKFLRRSVEKLVGGKALVDAKAEGNKGADEELRGGRLSNEERLSVILVTSV